MPDLPVHLPFDTVLRLVAIPCGSATLASRFVSGPLRDMGFCTAGRARGGS